MVSDLEHPNVKYLVTIHLSMSWLVTVHLAGWIDQRSISIKCFFFGHFISVYLRELLISKIKLNTVALGSSV